MDHRYRQWMDLVDKVKASGEDLVQDDLERDVAMDYSIGLRDKDGRLVARLTVTRS